MNTYLSRVRALNLLTKEDTDYLNDQKFYHKVALDIKEEKPLKEILRKFDIKSKLRLNRIISLLYKKGKLTSEDTLYLKSNKTVIGEKGSTKGKIVQFLESVHKGEATETVIELANIFNESDYRTHRAIGDSTFREHIKELEKKGKLSSDILDFYERCKNKRCNAVC